PLDRRGGLDGSSASRTQDPPDRSRDGGPGDPADLLVGGGRATLLRGRAGTGPRRRDRKASRESIPPREAVGRLEEDQDPQVSGLPDPRLDAGPGGPGESVRLAPDRGVQGRGP